MNTGAPEPDLDEVQARVQGIQTKLHRWESIVTRGEPDARRRARPVRRAGRGDGLTEKSTPRPGPTLQQQVVDDTLVAQRQRRQLLRQREDNMEVGHSKELRLAKLRPTPARRAQALGAMTVAAGVVGASQQTALGAHVDVTAHRGRAAAGDVEQHSLLLPRCTAPETLKVRIAVLANDVGDLDGLAGHDVSPVAETPSMSSGLTRPGWAVGANCM